METISSVWVDAFLISISAHACLLLTAVIARLFDWFSPVLAHSFIGVRHLYQINTRFPNIIPRVLSEQISQITIVAVTLCALSRTSVSHVPLSYQATPTPEVLIHVVLAACAGRQLVIAVRLSLCQETVVPSGGSLEKTNGPNPCGESGTLLLDFMYACVGATTAMMCLAFHENLLLGLTLPILDLSSLPVAACRLLDLEQSTKSASCRELNYSLDKSKSCLTYRRCAIVSFILTLLCRGVLPVLFVALALERESPSSMDRKHIVWFAASGFGLLCYYILLIYRAWRRVTSKRHDHGDDNKVISGFPPLYSEPARCCSSTSDSPVNSSLLPRRMPNDLSGDNTMVKRDMRSLTDDTYLLRPYDNRNVSACTSMTNLSTSDDLHRTTQRHEFKQLNLASGKETPKTWLIYRLFAENYPDKSCAMLSMPKYHQPDQHQTNHLENYDRLKTSTVLRSNETQPYENPHTCQSLTQANDTSAHSSSSVRAPSSKSISKDTFIKTFDTNENFRNVLTERHYSNRLQYGITSPSSTGSQLPFTTKQIQAPTTRSQPNGQSNTTRLKPHSSSHCVATHNSFLHSHPQPPSSKPPKLKTVVSLNEAQRCTQRAELQGEVRLDAGANCLEYANPSITTTRKAHPMTLTPPPKTDDEHFYTVPYSTHTSIDQDSNLNPPATSNCIPYSLSISNRKDITIVTSSKACLVGNSNHVIKLSDTTQPV